MAKAPKSPFAPASFRLPEPYRPPRTPSEERLFGAYFGEESAREMGAKHGCWFVERGARDLEAGARKRDATIFDKSYAKAYRAIAELCRRHGKMPPAPPARHWSLLGGRRR